MPEHALRVLRAIDQVPVIQERHPQLYAKHLRSDKTCAQLARAFERYCTERGEPVGGRVEHLDAEGPDRDWVDAEARAREEAFAIASRGRAGDIRARRRQMTLIQRLHATEIERERRSTVPAGNIAGGRGGDGPVGVPHQQLLDFDEADWFIRQGLEMREAVLDELAGLGQARDIAALLTLDKDRMLVGELAHLTPAQIEVAYSGRLGSAETVRRVRRRARRNAEQMEHLRGQGWSPGEIRERLGLTEDDAIVAREWVSAHGGQLASRARTPVTAEPDGR